MEAAMQSAQTMPVLFLDIDWQPLSVRSLKKTMKKVISGTVEVIEYSRDRTIRGEVENRPLPSVVRVLRRFRRDRIAIKFSRLNIYTRDGFRCQYCGEREPTEDLTFDHVVPRSQGGRTEWGNIVTCCRSCNRRKDAKTPEQAGMKLLRRPVKPRYLPVVTVQMDRRGVPPEWRDYWKLDLD
jgi:5-methylcytosine-specific restriction endonuclease McrA